MTPLRAQMLEELRLRNVSRQTATAYVRVVGHFAKWARRSPAELGAKEIRAFLIDLLDVRKIGISNYKAHLAGLKFLYRNVLRRPEAVAEIPWPNVPTKQPDIASAGEIQALLDAAPSARERVVWMIAYGCGLRISEVCTLQFQDIDRKRGVLHVRAGKGGKDRMTSRSVSSPRWRRTGGRCALPVPTSSRVARRSSRSPRDRSLAPHRSPGRPPGSPVLSPAICCATPLPPT